MDILPFFNLLHPLDFPLLSLLPHLPSPNGVLGDFIDLVVAIRLLLLLLHLLLPLHGLRHLRQGQIHHASRQQPAVSLALFGDIGEGGVGGAGGRWLGAGARSEAVHWCWFGVGECCFFLKSHVKERLRVSWTGMSDGCWIGLD